MKSSEQHKQDVISYLEQCSKHTFKNKENRYFFVRLSVDKLSYTFTTIESNGTKNSLTKSLEKMFENISVEIVKSYLKQKLFPSDMQATRRTKPVRKFIEGDMTIHIPEKYLVAEKENAAFQEAV